MTARLPIYGKHRNKRRTLFGSKSRQNAAESLPSQPEQKSVIKSVTISNPTLYTDPNNADHLSFTPFPTSLPVEAKEKERYEASDEYICGFERCKELAERVVDEHDGFLERIGHLDPVTSVAERKPTPSTTSEREILIEMVNDSAFAELCQSIGEEPGWLKKARDLLA